MYTLHTNLPVLQKLSLTLQLHTDREGERDAQTQREAGGKGEGGTERGGERERSHRGWKRKRKRDGDRMCCFIITPLSRQGSTYSDAAYVDIGPGIYFSMLFFGVVLVHTLSNTTPLLGWCMDNLCVCRNWHTSQQCEYLYVLWASMIHHDPSCHEWKRCLRNV